MKVFSTSQIAGIDQFTISNEPIANIDLMERASLQIVDWLLKHISRKQQLVFFVGPGNNGGDALAVARLCADHGFHCTLYRVDFSRPMKGSPAINWKRLEEQGKVSLHMLASENDLPSINPNCLVIDGLFGSGLTRSLDGLSTAIVKHINGSGAKVVAIDIPSGLMGENNIGNNLNTIVHADYTLTFQFPKLCFFFPEHEEITGKWEVLPIGLHPKAIEETQTPYSLINRSLVSNLLRKRKKYSHKGNYGHALLIAGSYGKIGASVLASRSCLRAGVGLLTTHIPRMGYEIIQSSVPEAMTSIDASDLMFTESPELSGFSAVGVGPGLDKKQNSQRALKDLLIQKPSKLVLDADALNILSENKDWYQYIPENAILTPHPKEFERLAGSSTNSYSRLGLQIRFSREWKVIVVLKGAHTCITFPNGRAFFNSSGNPGMATAGSGDVLTGIILGLLAQDYSQEHAALIGVYLHGLAGDIAVKKSGKEALIAGDIVNYMGKAFYRLHK